MHFEVQEAGGRLFFVNTTHGYLWEIGTGQWMDAVVINHAPPGLEVGFPPGKSPIRYDPAADRAAVVGSATREIDGRTFVGQFQPDDDQQAVDGHEQGDIDGLGTLTIREVLGVGKYDLVLEAPCNSRNLAWQLFDAWEPSAA